MEFQQDETRQLIIKINHGDELETQKLVKTCLDGKAAAWDRDHEYNLWTLGECIAASVREKLVQQHSLATKALSFREVRPSEIVRYDKDVHVLAYALDEYRDVQEIGAGRYVYPPNVELLFEVALPDVDDAITFMKVMREEALRKLIETRDAALFRLIDYVARRNQIAEYDSFDEAFNSLRYHIEKHRILAKTCILNRKTTNKFIKKLKKEKSSHLFEPAATNAAGFAGRYTAGTDIITRSGLVKADPIPEDVLYMLAPSEYIGWAPIKFPLTGEPLPPGVNKKKPEKMLFWEVLSMVVIDPLTIVAGGLKDGWGIYKDMKTIK